MRPVCKQAQQLTVILDFQTEYNLEHLTSEFEVLQKAKGSWVLKLPVPKTADQLRQERKARSARRAEKRAKAAAAESTAAADAQNAAMVNGHGTEQTTEGDQMEVDTSVVAPTNIVAPSDLPNGGLTAAAETSEAQKPEESASQAAEDAQQDDLADEDDEPILPYTWEDQTIYTMTLEKMQKKLYYDGYLSVSMFLEDLARIIHNAGEAKSVDAERFVKAGQMQNLANVLLEQLVDPAFKAECEAMAVRQRARDAKAREEAVEHPPHSARRSFSHPQGPERHSSRIAGEQPEHRIPVDVSVIEREERKRARHSDSDKSDNQDNQGRDKRVRVHDGLADDHEADAEVAPPQTAASGDPVIADPSQPLESANTLPRSADLELAPPALDKAADKHTSAEQPAAVNGHAETSPGPTLPLSNVVERAADQFVLAPSPAPTVGTGSGRAQQVHGGVPADAPLIGGAAPAPETAVAPMSATTHETSKDPTSEPPEWHPPYELDEGYLAKARIALAKDTDFFSIEQLEQLRAVYFDVIWTTRSDWRRTEVIYKVLSAGEVYCHQVRKHRKHRNYPHHGTTVEVE